MLKSICTGGAGGAGGSCGLSANLLGALPDVAPLERERARGDVLLLLLASLLGSESSLRLSPPSCRRAAAWFANRPDSILAAGEEVPFGGAGLRLGEAGKAPGMAAAAEPTERLEPDSDGLGRGGGGTGSGGGNGCCWDTGAGDLCCRGTGCCCKGLNSHEVIKIPGFTNRECPVCILFRLVHSYPPRLADCDDDDTRLLGLRCPGRRRRRSSWVCRPFCDTNMCNIGFLHCSQMCIC